MDYMIEILTRDFFLIENGHHNRDSVLILLGGSFICSVSGKEFVASENDICIFHAEDVFRRKILEPIRAIYIQFEPFPCPLPTGILKTSDPLRKESSIAHLTRAVLEENRQEIEHYMRDILILHQMAERESIHDETVQRCITCFHQRYAEHIDLNMLSAELAISKHGLIRKFKRVTQKTPIEYLTSVRIARAKELLTNSTRSVGEIAEQCGFDDMCYFSRCYKKKFGDSPLKSRLKKQIN